MKTEIERRAQRRRAAKLATAAGVGLAVLCHFVPPDYQAACAAVAKVAAVTCGGG